MYPYNSKYVTQSRLNAKVIYKVFLCNIIFRKIVYVFRTTVNDMSD